MSDWTQLLNIVEETMEAIEVAGEQKVVRRYERVNGAWPEIIPPLTPAEAVTAARRLLQLGYTLYEKPFPGVAVRPSRGRYRYTWERHNGVVVVWRRGWKSLVHDISHLVHRRIHPAKSGHDPRHEWLERQMAEHVAKSGWLEGKLKRPVKPKPPVTELRHQRVLQKLAAWKTKAKRAATAIKKLERQRRYYERQAQA